MYGIDRGEIGADSTIGVHLLLTFIFERGLFYENKKNKDDC